MNNINSYLAGKSAPPVSLTTTLRQDYNLTFTFSNDLLQRFAQDPDSMEKPYEKALKFGFKGFSQGGTNGIYLQRGQDRKMLVETDRLIEVHEAEILRDLDINKEGLDGLRKVKIVWHNPSGERVVGVYNSQNNKVLFLDFASY